MAAGYRSIVLFDLWKIAAALGTGKRNAERRAKKEGWPYAERCVRGGKQRIYGFDDLPVDVQKALLILEMNGLSQEIERARSDLRVLKRIFRRVR